MENALSIVADLLGILGFIMSLYAVRTVIMIKRTINRTDNSINQKAGGFGNTQSVTTNKP